MLRILHLEDDSLDTKMVLRLLAKDGLTAEIDRVYTSAAYREALAHDGRYALILADYSLPGVDPLEALALARQTRPELPFVFLTGTIGEETAIEMLKLGANDYVLKQRNQRLASAVRRALREAEEQSLRKQAEQDLRKAKEAAEKANRAKSQFLAHMSHELRTPMTVIMTAHQLLSQANLTPQDRKTLEMADAASHRLLGIIDDLLDVSRIEAGRLKVEERIFNLRDCVRQSVEMFVIPAREKGVKLTWEVSPQVSSEVIGDPARIGQVLVNLVGNAVKFTEKGEVAVTVSEGENRVVFSIRDTGIGIPSGKMDVLFQPFTQADASLTRRYGGAGLGLAISRELVGRMGGTMEADSEEGRGSTFSFTLPLRRVEAVTSATPSATAPEQTSARARILLAEDDSMVRDLYNQLLRWRGWDVALAGTGHEAIAQWQKGRIDLILMDLQMPEMDGLTATRKIREMEGGERESRTPIVALTAHARQEDRQESLSAGMDSYLSKPVRVEELYAMVDSCLSGDCRTAE